jgi:uncharacterized membrane protein YGL010W
VRLSGAALFSLGLAVLAAYAVYAALRWPPKAALFPLTMGIPLLVLALAQTIVEVREKSPSGGELRPVLALFAWMGVFIGLVLLAGFPIAVPLFVFFYLMVESREGLALSAVLAAAAWGAFHLLFERLLHFPFDDGLIRTWFQ